MSVLIVVNIVLSLVFKDHYTAAQDVESVILYGDDAKIEEYPFYASLNNCGAAILSHVWILTAAHCVENVDRSQRNYVWVGGESFANSVRVPYQRIHIHQGYHKLKGVPVNDIALIQLSHPLQYTKKIRPVKLPNRLKPNTNLSFVGRGIDEGDSGSPLVSGNTIVGLASFIGNLGCNNVRLGFFVNVPTFVPWIKAITGL
ncbi:unnamed protein product [Danaus chrysippus]|uniref:(African queen) hypothetical protein n=1 Tax=Danaus chrysippus TaxID=151541 RepID=A0A8J2REU0_9NEOP|nr:unnamed protein product [Danaus chrysippus]